MYRRSSSTGSSGGDRLSVEIRGDNLDILKGLAEQVRETMDASEDAITAAIQAIQAAAEAPEVDAPLLTEARDLHREAQLRWDFIAAENSMGFHNPEESLRILAVATDLARQAQLKAVLAAGTPEVIQAAYGP
jgi:nitrite reductase (cytochrome c-552)